MYFVLVKLLKVGDYENNIHSSRAFSLSYSSLVHTETRQTLAIIYLSHTPDSNKTGKTLSRNDKKY